MKSGFSDDKPPYKQDVAGSKPASGIAGNHGQTGAWGICSQGSGETAIRAGAAQNTLKPSRPARSSRSFSRSVKSGRRPPAVDRSVRWCRFAPRPSTGTAAPWPEVFRGGQNTNLAMVSSGQVSPIGSISPPAMAPPTWGLRLQRNGSGSACGLCLGGSSGRGIGARAPARLLHPLPPRSRLLLDPPRPPRPLLAATAAGSWPAGRSAAMPAPRSC